MELSKQELTKKLKEAVKKGYILPAQANDALKKFKNNGDLQILKSIEIQKDVTNKARKIIETKWHDLSDIEALQTIVRQNNTIINQQKDIKGWVTFLGIVTLIGLIGAVLAVNQ